MESLLYDFYKTLFPSSSSRKCALRMSCLIVSEVFPLLFFNLRAVVFQSDKLLFLLNFEWQIRSVY